MTQKKKNKKVPGRKWFDGKPETAIVAKLEEASAIDASVEECCFYADISRDSYYRYLEAHPVLRDRLTALKNKPVLKARQAVVSHLDDHEFAMKYLERKRKSEFSTRTETEVNDISDQKKIIIVKE